MYRRNKGTHYWKMSVIQFPLIFKSFFTKYIILQDNDITLQQIFTENNYIRLLSLWGKHSLSNMSFFSIVRQCRVSTTPIFRAISSLRVAIGTLSVLWYFFPTWPSQMNQMWVNQFTSSRNLKPRKIQMLKIL